MKIIIVALLIFFSGCVTTYDIVIVEDVIVEVEL